MSNPTELFDRPHLRFCFRVTTSAVLAFAVSQVLAVPLHGLWAVLTAVVVSQMSVGGSLKAAGEYVIGTVSGAAYSIVIALLVPHTTAIAMVGVLALAIAPLAYAAALSPNFRVAPFTAVLVLLISSQFREGPIESAAYRLLEVAFGGGVAVAVSLLVFPERAHALGLGAAACVMECLAKALPLLLAGSRNQVEPLENQRIQDQIGQAVDSLEAIAAEAQRERSVNLVADPDPAVLARTLLRLRHDLVVIGRLGDFPVSEGIAERLDPPLARIGVVTSDYLLANATALTLRRSPSPLEPVATALVDYASEIKVIREAGLMRGLPSSELERIFALGFVLQQLQRNLLDLARCVQKWARKPSLSGKPAAKT
jgi:uncharacterized membrane protein YccC